MNLMNAVGGISDRHIEDFAYVSPKKRRIDPWPMIIAAACLVVVVEIIWAMPKNRTGESDNDNDNLTHIDHAGSLAYLPCVYFNDRMYGYNARNFTNSELSGDYTGVLDHDDNISYSDDVVFWTACVHDDGYPDLPEGYVEVGEITTNDENNSNVNGYAFGTVTGLKIGDKIYQDPEDPEDLYVYTTLFYNSDKQYFHFVDEATYLSLRVNGKTYIADFTTDEIFLYELPDGYVEVGEVTTNDRKNKYADGFGRELYVGDKIFSSPDIPDVVYVYTDRFSTPLCYVRYIAYNE